MGTHTDTHTHTLTVESGTSLPLTACEDGEGKREGEGEGVGEGKREGGEFVNHMYCPGETLPGLALRYGVFFFLNVHLLPCRFRVFPQTLHKPKQQHGSISLYSII